MTDQQPADVATTTNPRRASTDDWPSIVGVGCITLVAVVALWRGSSTDHDIAVGAVGALGGWLSHGAVKQVLGR